MNLIDVNISPEEIKERLMLPYCSIAKQAVRIDLEGNSVVYCSQWFSITEIAKLRFPDIDISDLKVGINFVQIQGRIPEEEELHVHISDLVGIVVEGKGIIIYVKDGKECKEQAEAGDMVFVPKNTLHYFEGDPVIRYSAMEFGPTIDYQKHHHEKF